MWEAANRKNNKNKNIKRAKQLLAIKIKSEY